MYVTLSPAFGRDYRSAKAVKEDWDANKDFVIETYGHPSCGRYVNREQVIKDGHVYSVRYSKATKIVKVEG